MNKYFVPLMILVLCDDEVLRASSLQCQVVRNAHVMIGSHWSGARVNVDGIVKGSNIFVGYYDSDRWLTVAEIAREDNRICTVRVASRFAGWDSHNSVVLALDQEQRLHVAGNMHASPLVYARAEQPLSLEGLQLRPMIGRDEERVTYPTFLTAGDGALLFLYRSGGSGEGAWYVNRFNGDSWARIMEEPLFASRWGDKSVSAYPSAFVTGADGWFHVAIVWRRTPDAATNVAVSYARTRDFKTWSGHDGRAVNLPIDPGAADLVQHTGENAGLLNSAQVFIDPSGKPVIAYTKYGDDGRNVIVAARPANDRWNVVIVGTAASQTRLEGVGSLPAVPRFRNLVFDSARRIATIDMGFPGEPTRRYPLDYETLLPHGPAVDIPPLLSAAERKRLPVVTGLESPVESLVPVERAGDPPGAPPVGVLRYVTQATNRDIPRECRAEAPRACDPPPSPLTFVPLER